MTDHTNAIAELIEANLDAQIARDMSYRERLNGPWYRINGTINLQELADSVAAFLSSEESA